MRNAIGEVGQTSVMQRNFRWLLTASGISNLGSKIAREAMQMTAVITLGANPSQLSWLSVAATLPVLLLGLFAGAWIDRRRRRRIMIASDILRFAALISVPVAAGLGWLTITQMIVVVAMVATLSLLFDVADQALLPALVSSPTLLRANTQREQIDATTEIAGPPIGGWLVQVITAPMALVVDALSYLVSAALLCCVDHIETQVPRRRPPARQICADIALGLRTLWFQPILRPLLIARSLRTFFGAMLGAYYVLYLINRLGVSPAMLGLIIATGGIASLGGTLLIRWTAAWLPVGPGMILAFSIKTLGLALLPLAGLLPDWSLPLLIGQQVLQDGVTSYFAVHERHLRQKLVPADQLARISAAVKVANDGPVPLGALVAAGLVPHLGLDGVLWFAVAGYSLSAAVAFCSPLRRLSTV